MAWLNARQDGGGGKSTLNLSAFDRHLTQTVGLPRRSQALAAPDWASSTMQASFSNTGHVGKRKQTRRESLLAEMEQVADVVGAAELLHG